MSTTLSRIRIVLAAAYFLLVVLVHVGLIYADPIWAEGGIPLLIVGLPWSIPAMLILAGTSWIPGVGKVAATAGGNFLLFVLCCGGLNAVLIAGLRPVIRVLRMRMQIRILVAASFVLLVALAEFLDPLLYHDAVERSRPQNVRKSAVHVGGAVGWWQFCLYDSERNLNYCQIWNRAGLVLVEGEFVAYDGGEPAQAGDLLISDIGSGPDRVSLQNGRILIPKAREAEVRQFVDWMKGKRKRP